MVGLVKEDDVDVALYMRVEEHRLEMRWASVQVVSATFVHPARTFVYFILLNMHFIASSMYTPHSKRPRSRRNRLQHTLIT
jgi:hypothetical protein